MAAIAQAQTISLDFTVGILTGSTGTTPVANGALLQVIASADNVFATPTAGAFVGGNDTILWSGGFDSGTTGVTGAMQVFLAELPAATYAGQYLVVRWYPTLTLGSSLTEGISFGQYGYPNDSAWVAPGGGGTSGYGLLTSSSGFGTVPDLSGAATFTTAIPEPTTIAVWTGLFALGLAGWRRRRALRA